MENPNELFGQPNTLFCSLLSSFKMFWASLQSLAQLYGTPESLSPTCLVVQLCLTLCDAMDCSPPGSLVHEIVFQVRILEWVSISCSRGSSRPRN